MSLVAVRRRLLLWLPPVGYMALIFFASSVPGDEVPGLFWDKAVHFLVYAGLGVLFLLPLSGARADEATARVAAIAVALATLYGAFDEVHQGFTPDRTSDWRDLLSDFLGAFFGVAAMLILLALWRRVRRDRSTG